MITTNLLVAQFIACIGMVIWNFTVKQEDVTVQILVFIFLYSSLYSTYLWTGFLSFSLFLLRKRETVKIPIGFIIIAGWGVPTLLVGILLIIGEHNSSSIDSAFFYGKHQIITTAVVLFISILMSGISLMCMNRNRQESNYEVLNPYSPHGQAEGNEGNQVSATVPQPSARSSAQPSPAQSSAGCSAQLSAERGCCSCQTTNGEISCAKEGKAVPNAVENKVPSIETADQCVNQCSAQTCVLAQEEQLLQTADKQLARHVLLCLLLVVGLFANLSSCLWWLFNQEPGRLYVELQFFCAVFNFGQGFISFGIFGLDKHLIILPFKRRLEFLWGGREAEGHADPTLPEEIRMTCQQFVHYHRDHCVKSIVKGRR
ncbi:integral membrane protein GPR155-like [Meleagris gallopavo]|uniref:integral membrane protein GPR155-like n=1 Tax=Meleagris gallopavo TaxID=9103 RepID=UPI000549BE47|nr:integral membrane protein GPR155-like [Meleagris gallopavo]